MSSAAKAHEPTMEEILASIRRIISDDEPGRSMTAPKAAPAPEPAPESIDAGLGQEDIDAMFAALDTPEPPRPAAEPTPIEAPRAPEPPAAALAPIGDDFDVFELTEEMAGAAAAAPEPQPATAPPERAAPLVVPRPAAATPAPLSTGTPERLLSANADDAVSNAFGSLAHTILSSNARTLDDIVREMLRPMLREWLDDNLPPMVERLVRAEIERVARGGR